MMRKCATYGRMWIVALCAGSFTFAACGDEKATLETIQKAWRQRQDKVKSVKVQIDTKALHAKESQVSVSGGRYPKKDTVIDQTYWISLKDNKVRYAYKAMVWSDQKGDYGINTLSTAFNGSVAKSVSTYEGVGVTGGKITTLEQYMERHAPDVLSLAAHFRPLDLDHHHLELKDTALTKERVTINDIQCVELRWENANSKMTEVYYLDPTRDYSIVRVLRLRMEIVLYQSDWTLKMDPKASYVPVAWKKSWRGSGGAMVSEECKLSIEINSCPDSEFEIVFPPGCVGFDYISRKQFRIPESGEQPSSQAPMKK